MGLPNWYKYEQKEFRNNPILYACAKAGMSAEEAVSYLAAGYADLHERACKLVECQNVPIIVHIPNRSGNE